MQTISRHSINYTSKAQKEKVALAHFLLHDAPTTESFSQLAIAEGLSAAYLHHLEATKSAIEPELQQDVKQAMLLHMLQEWAMQQADNALKAAGIPCLWLKGAALAHTVYEAPHLRLKNDLDCLVSPEDYPRAREIIMGLGYHEPEYSLNIVAYERRHHSYFIHQQYPQIIFELHHRLLGTKGEEYMPPEILAKWFKSPLPFGNYLTLKPEYHFLYLCAHCFLQHGEAYVRLRDYYDLHLLLSKPFDWDLLLAEAKALKWTFLLSYSLKRLQDYFPSAVPIMSELEAHDKSGEAIAPILLKASEDNRGENVLEYLRIYSWKERLQKISQMLFPSQEYMRQRYAIPPNQSPLPWYAYRLFDQTQSMAKTLWRRFNYWIHSR